MADTNAEAAPFTKAVGGKRRIVHELIARLPPDADQRRHVEPFVGGGALFFARKPADAILTDLNHELISAYHQVRDYTEPLIERLRELATDCSEKAYYETRDVFNHWGTIDATHRAANFIYLNKLCFNGLHRVNRKGEFNVPWGKYKNPKIFDEATLRATASELQRARLWFGDFATVSLEHTSPGDFWYADPPYEPLSRTANFTAYTAFGFTQDDQRRLRDIALELTARGCKCMLSNSDTPFIRELYRDFRIDTIQAPRAVSCKGDGRKPVGELIIRNYS